MLDEAHASGRASESQLAILEQSAKIGTVTWSDYRDAVTATLNCFDQAGIPYIGPAESVEQDVQMLTYAAQTGVLIEQSTSSGDIPPDTEVHISASPDSGPPESNNPVDALAEECRQANSQYVEAAWEAQPSSLATQDAFFKQKLPALVACAQKNELAVDESAPVREMLAGLVAQGELGRQCLHDSGISAF